MPSAPKAPDPYATAQAQNSVNQEAIKETARINQINEKTPFGSRTYTGSYDTGDRSVVDSLSPELQSILDSQLRTTGGLSGLAERRLQGIPQGDFSLDGMPNVRRAGGVQFNESMGTPQAFSNYSFSDIGPAQAFGNTGSALQVLGEAGPIKTQLNDTGRQMREADLSGVQQIAGLGDFGGERNRVEDALYGRGSRRVNERYGEDLSSLQAQLAAQGITQGSTAYDREMKRLSQSRDDALMGATEGAIINAGQEQGRLFGQSLQARQQGVGEQFGLADLYNRAQAGDFGQELAGSQFINQAQQQNFGQQLDRGNFYNQGQAQNFGQDFARVNADRDMQRFYTTTQDARTEADRSRDLARVLSDRDWQQQQANFGNQARGQQFNAGLQLQDADTQFRQSGINENILARNQNLNELMSLLSGNPISPQGQLSFQPRAQYNPAQGSPDLVSTANNNFSAANQARSALLGSIFGAAGQIGGAAARCWVAREVYGAQNPRWLMFRDWLDSKAPAWFRNLYIKFGERFAAWIADKPKIKSAIRKWMDARIA
jgi:hypothetical protein